VNTLQPLKLFICLLLFAGPLQAAGSFKVLIDGLTSPANEITEIEIDDLIVDIRETTTGLDVEYRLYAPGSTHWGQARFAVAEKSKTGEVLKRWFAEAQRGSQARKSVSIIMLADDGSTDRSYTLLNCAPVKVAPAFDSARQAVNIFEVIPSQVIFGFASEQRAISSGSHDFSFREVVSDPWPTQPRSPFATLRGFKVQIEGPSGKEVDTAWESVSGGEILINLASSASSQKFTTTSPGHKSVNSVTLRGAMTNTRRELSQWINDTTQGKPWKRNVTLTELLSAGGDGVVHSLESALPRRYRFPRLSIYNDRPLIEEVELVVVRSHPELAGNPQATLHLENNPVQGALLVGIQDLNIQNNLPPDKGDARSVLATIALQPSAEGKSEILEWFKLADAGVSLPKQLSVTLYRADGLPSRTYSWLDCFPVGFATDDKTGAQTFQLQVTKVQVK